MLYQNVRGFKSEDLYLRSFGCSYEVIAFTETWLKEVVNDSEILCDNYQVYRKYR